MNFGNLKILSLAFVPQGKASAINNTTRELLINLATADVAVRTNAIRTYEDFTSVTGQAKYNLSDNLTRFISMDEGGVWFDDDDGFRELRGYSIGRMRNEFPNFQEDNAADPLRYYILGDDLYLHPAVETGAASAIRVYFVQRPMVMTADNHFPFHKAGDQTVETERLEILSESILLYVESRCLKILGEDQAAIVKYQEYRADLENKITLINARPDISISKYSKFQGPKIL